MSAFTMRRLNTTAPDFDARLADLTGYDSAQDASVEATARAILADVRLRGDVALLEYTRKLDGVQASVPVVFPAPGVNTAL